MHRHLLRRGPAPLANTLQTLVYPSTRLSRAKATSSPAEAEKDGAAADVSRSGDARGRTGGGKPLAASDHPPPQPKILNAKVPGGEAQLTDEQQREVDQHNKEFEQKHDRAGQAPGDKVNKQFWGNEGNGANK